MDRYALTFAAWNKLALAYQEKFMELGLYNDTYDAFCELIQTPNARIFEIGCGPGNITRYLLTQRPDFQIEGIDVAPSMVALAQANNPVASFHVRDARDLDQQPGNFDGIMCGFCLPYLSGADCAKLINDCAALLPCGGVLYLSTIEGDYQNSGYETGSTGQDKMYVYYHAEEDLRLLLQENGFEVTELVRKPFLEAEGASSTHLMILSTKQ